MEHRVDGALSSEERTLVDRILTLPHKIVENHHLDGLAQMVLYDIAGPRGFGLKRAAYLVDNPDFDCLHGIAGFGEDDDSIFTDDVWLDPARFAREASSSKFNVHVKSFRSCSLKRKSVDFDVNEYAKALASKLEMQNPSVFNLRLKHGNYGLFLFEPRDNVCVWRRSVLASVVALLGLCAI